MLDAEIALLAKLQQRQDARTPALRKKGGGFFYLDRLKIGSNTGLACDWLEKLFTNQAGAVARFVALATRPGAGNSVSEL